MPRKRVISVICLLAIALSLPSQATISDQETFEISNFTEAKQLFVSSGADLESVKLKSWGLVHEQGVSLSGLEAKYLDLAQALGLDQDQKVTQIDRDGFVSLSQLTSKSETAIQLFLQAIPALNGDTVISYGIAVRTSDIEQAERTYWILREICTKWRQMEVPSVEFCGIITESLSAEARLLRLQLMAQSSGAQYIEGIHQDRLTSLTYYQQAVPDYLEIQGRRINLNLALRTNQKEQRTRLVIGLPLIFSDY